MPEFGVLDFPEMTWETARQKTFVIDELKL